jgi:hypothetical protein
MAKQLTTAAFVLAAVTVLSFGIRQVRFSVHRADTGESTPSARLPDSEDQPQLEQPLHANAEPDHYAADSHTVDAEPDPQHANASDSDKGAPSDDHSEASESDEESLSDDYSEAKSFKGDYAKSKGSKGLKKISMGDNDNLYITGEGQLWYVSEQPDGKTIKMQVQIDETTGEMTIVAGGGYARSEGSQGLQRIPLGDREDLYITGEGQLWYVSEQPDGSTGKMQVQIDETTGEMTIVDSGEMNAK